MRVLFLTNLYPYPLNSGGAIHSYTIIKALSKMGSDIDLICFKEKSSDASADIDFISSVTLSLSNLFFTFIWPTPFWFIGAIVLFYLLFYITKEVKIDKHFIALFLILMAVYFLYYFALLDTSTWTIETGNIYTVNGFFRLIYYFAAMMTGKYFRINSNKPFKQPVLYLSLILLGGVTLFSKISYEQI